MEYKLQVIKILHELGVDMKYKGCTYIVSGIDFIQQSNGEALSNVKVIYIEVAKQCDTSIMCVEKDIRKVVSYIWSKENNEDSVKRIFGNGNSIPKPGNKQFLFLLYKFIILSNQNKYTFKCPISGNVCRHCSTVIYEFIKSLYCF